MSAQGSDLRQYVGQQVRVSGSLLDSGENTIGTSGTSGHETPSGQRSQAGSDQHHAGKVADEMGPLGRESLANGTAPWIEVANITPTGEGCAQQQHRVR